MNDHDVFVAAGCSAGALRAVIEAALGTSFGQGQGTDPVPVLLAGATKVFFHESHPFEDDVDFAVSRDCFWVSVHDAARDSGRQLAVARRVFDAAKAQGWPVMLSFGLQGHVAVYP
jgi:hypothetical protein